MPTEQRLIALGADPSLFPKPESALEEPNGLLAIGGDLSPERLLNAYRLGIFPWYEEDPILWWSPNPRAVLFLKDFHLSKSLQKTLKKNFQVKVDHNFKSVIQHCAAPRLIQGKRDPGTWLSAPMQAAYIRLHELGYAHSLEIYLENDLVGGIYGVSMGRNFFGESMFSLQTDTSKVALYYLTQLLTSWDFEFIDCQVWNSHLASLGATEIPRQLFLEKIAANNKFDSRIGTWQFEISS